MCCKSRLHVTACASLRRAQERGDGRNWRRRQEKRRVVTPPSPASGNAYLFRGYFLVFTMDLVSRDANGAQRHSDNTLGQRCTFYFLFLGILPLIT